MIFVTHKKLASKKLVSGVVFGGLLVLVAAAAQSATKNPPANQNTSQRPAQAAPANTAQSAAAQPQQIPQQLGQMLNASENQNQQGQALIYNPSTAPSTTQPDLADDLPEIVNFELGVSGFQHKGDNITITEVRGTTDLIKPNNTYEVKGTYDLNSYDIAGLHVYVSPKTPASKGKSVFDPRQGMYIQKGQGEFKLFFTVTDPGYPHVSMYPNSARYSTSIGTVYFGTGDESVLRVP